jgi:hypothetical protein
MVPKKKRVAAMKPKLRSEAIARSSWLPVHDRVPAETKRDRTAELPKIKPPEHVRKPFRRAP